MNDSCAQAKMLNFSDAEDLRRSGWKAADLHVHTAFSSDVVDALSLQPMMLYRKAKQIGMDFVTFTDHDTMDAYDTMEPEATGLVRGVEIKIKDIETVGHTIHVNVYELDCRQLLKLQKIAARGDLHGFLDILNGEGLPFVYNHPLWFEPGEKPNLAAIPDLVGLFPVIEYNMHRIRRQNEIVMELAKRFKKGLIASTDTHSGMIGQAYTLSKGRSFREFYDNICRGDSYIVVRDQTKQYLTGEMNTWLDMISRHDMTQDKKITTGIANLDRIISILGSETLKDFPVIYRAALAATYRTANSGLPAALYIRRESSRMCEIERTLGIRD